MNRKRLLKHLVFLMFFIFIVDSLAQYFYWYSLIWYFDMIMHFLGGFWEGLFFVWFFSIPNLPLLRLSLEKIDFKFALKTLLFVLFVGISWEVYEYILNIISHVPWDWQDTSSDVFFDFLGSLVSTLYLVKVIMPERGNTVQ